MKSLFVVLFSLLSISISAQEYVPDKRMRVIIDNDFGGDPDGLFQLAHHLLSPSVEICGIIGSPLTPEAGFDNGGNSAEKACQKARLLKPGQSQVLTMTVNRKNLAFWDSSTHQWSINAGTYTFLIGASATNIRQQTEIIIK